MIGIAHKSYVKILVLFALLWGSGLMDLALALEMQSAAEQGVQALDSRAANASVDQQDDDEAPCTQRCLSELPICLGSCPALPPGALFSFYPPKITSHPPGTAECAVGLQIPIDPGPPKTMHG